MAATPLFMHISLSPPNLHDADPDMSNLDERVTESGSDRQPFFFKALLALEGRARWQERTGEAVPFEV